MVLSRCLLRVFIFSFQYKYRVNLSGSTVQTSEQLVKSKSLEYVNNYAFLCIGRHVI